MPTGYPINLGGDSILNAGDTLADNSAFGTDSNLTTFTTSSLLGTGTIEYFDGLFNTRYTVSGTFYLATDGTTYFVPSTSTPAGVNSGNVLSFTAANGPVDGTAAGESMSLGYTDAQGDLITNNADTINGNDGNDTINGAGGADTINAGSGDDTIILNNSSGAFGNDVIVGGETGESAGDTIDTSSSTTGMKVTYNTAESGTISDGTSTATFSEVEKIVLTSQNDTVDAVNVGTTGMSISTGAGADTVIAGAADDTIDGGTGNDNITGGGGDDSVLGGDGNDTLIGDGTVGGTSATSTTYTVLSLGTAADMDTVEYVSGTSQNQVVENASSLLGTYGTTSAPLSDNFATVYAPTATGSSGGVAALYSDSSSGGTAAADTFYINGVPVIMDSYVVYNATLTFADGTTKAITAVVFQTTTGEIYMAPEPASNADLTAMESGQIVSLKLDSINDAGTNGTDALLTQSRIDTNFVQSAGDDYIDGGLGNDSILGNAGNDTLLGGDGLDTIDGGIGDDSISGGPGNDSILGGAGNDIIDGGDGADRIDGGTGNDSIVGGAGADTIIGGTGNDTIVASSGDSVTGGDGDDFFLISNLGPTPTNITIVGGEGAEGAGDTLDFNYLLPNGLASIVYTNTNNSAGGLSGVATLADGSTVTFSEIETILYCFATGTRIATPEGGVAVERLSVGDKVHTRDRGPQPIRWISKRAVEREELEQNPKLRPVRISAGALGGGLPERDLVVSRQHRVLVASKIVERVYDRKAVLVPAKDLVGLDGIFLDETVDRVEYVHFLFDNHEIVYAEDVPTESLYTGPEVLDSLSPEARTEIFTLFPELDPEGEVLMQPAEIFVQGKRARKLLERHKMNAKPVIAPEQLL